MFRDLFAFFGFGFFHFDFGYKFAAVKTAFGANIVRQPGRAAIGAGNGVGRRQFGVGRPSQVPS
jgi:hypothetical protein